MKIPQDYENNSIILVDDSSEKEINNDKREAIFKRGRHNNLSFFIISQDYYELPRRTFSLVYHIFKPNNFRDVQNLYQDKVSMDMTLNEFKLLTSTCWNKNYQPLTIGLAKDRYQGRYGLGLNNVFVPDSSPF